MLYVWIEKAEDLLRRKKASPCERAGFSCFSSFLIGQINMLWYCMPIRMVLVVRARRNNGNADDTDDADFHGFFDANGHLF